MGLHLDLVAEGGGNGIFGAQMHNALFAIDKNFVAIKRLGGDPLGMDDQRNGQRARNNRGMAADRAIFQNNAFKFAPVFQQFARPDIAGNKHGVFGHLGASICALPCQKAQQLIGQIIQILQPFAQIGIGHRFHAGPCGGLLFLHGGLGREAALDVFFHAAQPTARIGEHAIGFKHLALFAIGGAANACHHGIKRQMQLADRLMQALKLQFGVICHGAGDDNARLMQIDMAFGHPVLRNATTDHELRLVPLGQGLALTDEGAKLSHFGQHHGDHFDGVDLIFGIAALILGLDNQNPKPFAKPHDRHAEERGIPFLARLGHIAKALGGGRIGCVDGAGTAGHAAHKTLAHTHPCDMDRFGGQTFGGA